jgi:hypothetical protein
VPKLTQKLIRRTLCGIIWFSVAALFLFADTYTKISFLVVFGAISVAKIIVYVIDLYDDLPEE